MHRVPTVAENESNHGTTILVAEDEAPLRELLQRILHSAGYQLLIAPDGRKALEVACHHQGKIDLLLTDVVMPEMSGVELATALKAKHPESHILLTSAHPEGMLLMDHGWHFIQKPYFPRRLLDEVRRVLSINSDEFKPEEHE